MNRIPAAFVNKSLAFGLNSPVPVHVAIKFFSCCPYPPILAVWGDKVGVKPLKRCCVFLLANRERLWCGSGCWV